MTTVAEPSTLDIGGTFGDDYCHVALQDATPEVGAICGYRGPDGCIDVLMREAEASEDSCRYCKRSRCPSCARIIDVWAKTGRWEGTMTPLMAAAIRERR